MSNKMPEETRFRVINALLTDDSSPKSISTEFDVSYAQVLRIKNDIEKGRREQRLAEVLNIDEAILDQIGELAAKTIPMELSEQAGEVITELKQTKTALESLDTELCDSAKYLSQRIKSFAMGANSSGELLELTDALSNLRNAFFNSNATQVNIQNNHGEQNAAYGAFLNDKPGA